MVYYTPNPTFARIDNSTTMLKVQNLLNSGHTLKFLEEEYGIKITYSDVDSRIILNYSQIESPKYNDVVRECRGLCLEKDTWKIVGSSFRRFYNYGEIEQEDSRFNWNNFSTTEKVDGSLILLYYYNDSWHIQTRGSFGNGNINSSKYTWRQLVESIFDTKNLKFLNPNLCYNLELCSRYNKVVRDYPEPKLYLLACFDKQNQEVFLENEDLFSQPETYHFNSLEEVKKYIEERSVDDATYEGMVLKDINNNRLKIKSSLYVSLHHLKGNSNIFNVKHLLPWILKGEAAEIHLYFPECDIYKYDDWVWNEYDKLEKRWNEVRHIENQKDFALAISDELFKSVLFQVRRSGNSLKEQFILSENLILKVIKDKLWD